MRVRELSVTIAIFALGCHPPPPELVEAKRVVVVVGPPQAEAFYDEPSHRFYRETPFQTLAPSACAAACPEVAREGERLTSCYVLPSHAWGLTPAPDAEQVRRHLPDNLEALPSMLHVCTLRPIGDDE